MGKNKGQGPKRTFKKDPVATKVAAGVKKTKTKAVVSNLKRITVQNKARTEDLDAQFKKLQQTTLMHKAETSHSTAAAAETGKTLDKESKGARRKREKAEAPDVDIATEELSKLVS